MKIIIGTYRANKAMIDRCYDSMITHLADTERNEFWFVDDSGDDEFRGWLERYGKVVGVGRENQGYAKAMDKVCEVMRELADEYVMFWEEDFVATKRVHLDSICKALDTYPRMAQIVLPRQPWFPREVELGSMMKALAERKNESYETKIPWEEGENEPPLFEHTMTFSCNPAVWAPMAYRWPWPQCNDSEDHKTRYLVDDYDNACFAFWGDEPLVHHDGERLGKGY